ncbi:MAG: UbiA family prenyltransferase [Thermoplasmata archaeon]
MAGKKLKGLIITMRPKIGIVTFPWVAAMALFASVLYGDFSSPIHSDSNFYITFLLIMLGSYLGVTSGYAVNDYFDAELDTASPIDKAVKHGIPKKALLSYAAILGIPSLVILLYLSIYTGIVGIIQMLCILVYSKSMKGKVAYSNMFVVLPTALMPMGVFFVYTDQFTIEALLLFITYFFFEPGFTWSGVCRDTEHDKKRGVPTLSVKYGIKGVAKFILMCWILVLVMSVVLFLFTNLGLIFLIGSSFAAVLLIGLAINLIKNPHPKTAASTFIKSAGWFWFFSFSVIIDVVLRIAGIVLPGVNLP